MCLKAAGIKANTVKKQKLLCKYYEAVQFTV